MGQFKKVISTSSTRILIDTLVSLFKDFDFGKDYGDDFCDELHPLLLTASTYHPRGCPFAATFDDMMPPSRVPELALHLFKTCRTSEEVQMIFKQFVLPSLSLEEYTDSIKRWHASHRESLSEAELEYLRDCTESKLPKWSTFDQRLFDNLDLRRKARHNSKNIELIEDFTKALLDFAKTERPRILNVGCGTGSEIPGICNRFAATAPSKTPPPFFYNIDANERAIRISSKISDEFNVTHISLCEMGENFSSPGSL